jgi:hypothetical protein
MPCEGVIFSIGVEVKVKGEKGRGVIYWIANQYVRSERAERVIVPVYCCVDFGEHKRWINSRYLELAH